MKTYEAVKSRIIELCGQYNMTINRLANEAGVSPSSLKNILYGKSRNPGVATIKMLCDGWGITISEFFDTDTFKNLEQEMG